MNMGRNIKLLYYLNFFTDFIFFAPVAIIYFAKVTGSYALGMSIFSVAYVSAALFEVPTGIVSDMVGRRVTTILGALSALLCVVLYALSGSYWGLFVGAIFQGLSHAFYSGNNDALLHDTLSALGKEKSYHTYLGKTSSMFQVALAIASFAGGFLAAKSFTLVMWLSVIPQSLALITAYFLVEPLGFSKSGSNIYLHLKEAFGQFKVNPKLRLLTSTSVLRFSLGESAFFLRSVFINSLWPLWAVGVSYTLSFIGGAASFWYSGKIIDKYKPLKVLNFEIIYNRVINFTALLFPSVLSPALMSGSSLTYGISSVAQNSLLQKEFTQTQRATMASLNSFVGNIAFGISSFGLGLIADGFGTRVALIVVHTLLLLPLIYYRQMKVIKMD